MDTGASSASLSSVGAASAAGASSASFSSVGAASAAGASSAGFSSVDFALNGKLNADKSAFASSSVLAVVVIVIFIPLNLSILSY